MDFLKTYKNLQLQKHQQATGSEESCPFQQLKKLCFYVTFWGSEQLLQQMWFRVMFHITYVKG